MYDYNPAVKLYNFTHTAILFFFRDPDTVLVTRNEAYQVVKQTGGTDESYETVTTTRNVPPSTTPSSQPTAGDSVYEPV